MKALNVILSLILATAMVPCCGQAAFSSKTIRHQGNFKHASGMVFPEEFAGYPRTEIRVFGQGTDHVSVGYDAPKGKWAGIKSTFFVYPYPESNLHSLRGAFLEAADAIVQLNPADSLLKYESFMYRKEDYIIQGLVAVTPGQQNMLAMFQCGKWMFKVRVSAENLDGEKRKAILSAIADTFDLSRLVKDAPWNVKKMKVVMYKHIIRDDTLLMCALIAAATHKLWALNNVSKNELKAGIPGLHLEGFVGGLKLLLLTWEKLDKKTSPKATGQLEALNRVDKAGFLDEYVYVGFQGTVVGEKIPTEARLQEFETWRRENSVGETIFVLFYGLAY